MENFAIHVFTGLIVLWLTSSYWFFVTFVIGYFARDLSFSFFGCLLSRVASFAHPKVVPNMRDAEEVFARGLVRFAAPELDAARGRPTADFEGREVIHRDQLVVLED